MTTLDLIRTSPGPGPDHADRVAAAIEACAEAARACTQCADACLAEEGVADLRACIRLDADCADLCAATSRVLARSPAQDTALTQVVLQACVAVTRLCAEECESHAGMHRHCALCAETCRRAEEACKALLAAIV
jgi:hypothetical protein